MRPWMNTNAGCEVPCMLPFLLPFSILYGLVLTFRRRHWPNRNSARLDAPVISVGNITCGGTGKTPTVEMVVRELIDRGWNPAILSRGYGAPPGISDGNFLQVDFNEGNDEYRLLSENLPSVLVLPLILGLWLWLVRAVPQLRAEIRGAERRGAL